MPEREAIAMWRSRLRWRLSGAWQWPTFTAATLAGAVVLSRLPFAGAGMGFVPAFLLAGFLNLGVVAALGPLGGHVLRRRRPTLPKAVAADRAAAAGMVALLALLIAAGVAHRPAVRANDEALATAVSAARRFAAHRAPAAYRAGLDHGDTWQQGPSLFRTCFPGPDPRRDFCVIVRTDEPVPIMRRDPDQQPNATIAGPDNPGRSAG
jgi:hypothetical protein